MSLKTLLIAVSTINHISRSFPLFSGLSGFTLDPLVGILDAFAEIGLRRSLFPYFGCYLTDLLFIGTGNDDRVGVGDVEGDAGRLGENDLMRISDIEHKLVPLLCRTVSDAVDLKLLLVSFGNAYNHIVDKRTGESVKGFMLLVLGRALDMDKSAVKFYEHIGVKFLCKRTLGAFDGNNVTGGYIHRYAGGEPLSAFCLFLT